MLESWRFKLRQAEDAMRQQRLAEAARLIHSDKLLNYAPGKKLAEEVSHALAQRSVGKMDDADASGAWLDYDLAVSVEGMTQTIGEVGEHLEYLATAHVERLLDDDDIAAALTHLDLLEQHCRTPKTTALRDAARYMNSARDLSQRGRFSEALTHLENAARLKPELQTIENRQNQYQQQMQNVRQLEDRLFHNVSAEDWSQALVTADQILEFAPEHQMASDARRRAWLVVGNDPQPVQSQAQESLAASNHGTAVMNSSADSSAQVTGQPRFLLWVDGVGGFLVCQSEEVSIGQAVPGSDVDIAIQADLSRRHATIRRDGEGYVLVPQGSVSVNGRRIADRTLLSDGDELTLGEVVRLRFCKPHALSATARLDFISRHRSQPTADSVLLMAESCVLGPRLQNHVICRDWSGDVVLFRQDANIFCRSLESIEIDGQQCEGRGQVGTNSRVVGDDFSMSLEAID